MSYTDYRRLVTDSNLIDKFTFAGRAIFTLVSRKTRTRFTYRIKKMAANEKWKRDVFFVSVLTGPDNTRNYSYIGMVAPGSNELVRTKGSQIDESALSSKAIDWFLRNTGSSQVEFWHEGRCGRCGRCLTVPESIQSGFGPTCIGRG